jgi:hypothetical protein
MITYCFKVILIFDRPFDESAGLINMIKKTSNNPMFIYSPMLEVNTSSIDASQFS